MELFDKNGKMSKEMFAFLRYNQIRGSVELSEQELAVFNQVNKLLVELKESLENNDNKASSILGNIVSIFGFNRHYCALSGVPIIGKYFKIGNKIVSKEAYDSWKIVQEMQKVDERVAEHYDTSENTSEHSPNTNKNKTKNR